MNLVEKYKSLASQASIAKFNTLCCFKQYCVSTFLTRYHSRVLLEVSYSFSRNFITFIILFFVFRIMVLNKIIIGAI